MIEMNNYTVIGNAIYQAIKKNHEKIYYSDIIKFSELVADKLRDNQDNQYIYSYMVYNREIDDFIYAAGSLACDLTSLCDTDNNVAGDPYIISKNYKFGASILDNKAKDLLTYSRYYRLGNPKIFVDVCDEVGDLVWDEKPSLKDTRVEEMVQDICPSYIPGCEDCFYKQHCKIREHCECLYDKGYRKTTYNSKKIEAELK